MDQGEGLLLMLNLRLRIYLLEYQRTKLIYKVRIKGFGFAITSLFVKMATCNLKQIVECLNLLCKKNSPSSCILFMENWIRGLLKNSSEIERNSSEITVIQTVIRISEILQ